MVSRRQSDGGVVRRCPSLARRASVSRHSNGLFNVSAIGLLPVEAERPSCRLLDLSPDSFYNGATKEAGILSEVTSDDGVSVFAEAGQGKQGRGNYGLD